MKRTLCAILVSAILLSMASCGKDKNNEQSSSENLNLTEYEYVHVTETYTKQEVGVSLEGVYPGDRDFKPGKYYGNLPKLTFRKDSKDPLTLGLWCWDTNILYEQSEEEGISCDLLLDIMIQNNINELYLSLLSRMQNAMSVDKVGKETNHATEMEVRGFIKKCSEYGIKVYALEGIGGDAALRWMEPEDRTVKNYIKQIGQFNANSANDDEKIAGLHLDWEPVLATADKEQTNKRYQNAAEFFKRMKMQCDDANIKLQYDINAWTKEDQMVYIDGKQLPFIDYLTQTVDNLTVMAYRNNAKAQWEEAMIYENSNEMNWAAKNNCNILVGAETSPASKMGSEAIITYDYAGGNVHLIEQFEILRKYLLEYNAPRSGAAIHHLDAFYRLLKKDKEY